MLRARRHHEVLDAELTAALEEIGQRQLSLRTVEDVLLLEPNPGKFQAQRCNRVSVAGQGFLMLQERNTPFEPFLWGYNLILHEPSPIFSITGVRQDLSQRCVPSRQLPPGHDDDASITAARHGAYGHLPSLALRHATGAAVNPKDDRWREEPTWWRIIFCQP